MIKETIVDEENKKSLSIHFNDENKLCITIENSDDYDIDSFQFIHLDIKDVDCIIKNLKIAKNNL